VAGADCASRVAAEVAWEVAAAWARLGQTSNAPAKENNTPQRGKVSLERSTRISKPEALLIAATLHNPTPARGGGSWIVVEIPLHARDDFAAKWHIANPRSRIAARPRMPYARSHIPRHCAACDLASLGRAGKITQLKG
jgi:hypothetical protein